MASSVSVHIQLEFPKLCHTLGAAASPQVCDVQTQSWRVLAAIPIHPALMTMGVWPLLRLRSRRRGKSSAIQPRAKAKGGVELTLGPRSWWSCVQGPWLHIGQGPPPITSQPQNSCDRAGVPWQHLRKDNCPRLRHYPALKIKLKLMLMISGGWEIREAAAPARRLD